MGKCRKEQQSVGRIKKIQTIINPKPYFTLPDTKTQIINQIVNEQKQYISRIAMNKSRSVGARGRRPNHTKSVNLIVQSDYSPLKVKPIIPTINLQQTQKLITRLSDTSHGNSEDYSQELDRKSSELRSKCDKLYATIDLFQLMDSNNMTIRCMQHNNTLTLYCLTERKILCVNCTYGDFRHRTHKVLPLRDSSRFIGQDNEQLGKILKEDFRVLEESIKNAQDNVVTLSNSLSSTLKKAEQEHLQRKKELQSKYLSMVSKVKERFEGLICKSGAIERQIEDFKFKIYEALSRIGFGKGSEAGVGEVEIIKQVITSAFTEVTKFQFKKVTSRHIQRLKHLFEF